MKTIGQFIALNYITLITALILSFQLFLVFQVVSVSVAFQLAVYAFVFQIEDAAFFIRRFLSLLGSSKHERDERLKIHF